MRRRILLLAFLAFAATLSLYAADWSMNRMAGPMRADRIVIAKAAHRLTLYAGGQAVASYRVALGRGGLAPKRQAGDGLVPEGHYFIAGRLPSSAYHRALQISYPDAAERAGAKARGVDPGGAIMIHGLPNGLGWLWPVHWLVDWTAGCIALSDGEMDELWRVVKAGTPVDIDP